MKVIGVFMTIVNVSADVVESKFAAYALQEKITGIK